MESILLGIDLFLLFTPPFFVWMHPFVIVTISVDLLVINGCLCSNFFFSPHSFIGGKENLFFWNHVGMLSLIRNSTIFLIVLLNP